ncbi:MAG: ATP-dependent DNA helicase RecG [Actinomycetes bacterium]
MSVADLPELDPFDEPLARLLGRPTAQQLAKLELHRVRDLLMHLPRRYARRGQLQPLGSIPVGEDVTVMGEVTSVSRSQRNVRGGARRPIDVLKVMITDGRSQLELTFFNQPWRTRELTTGAVGLFAGKVGEFRGQKQLTHPDYELLGADGGDAATAFVRPLIPIYPATAGLPSWRIDKAVGIVLDTLHELPDPLPSDVRQRHALPDLLTALRHVHRPETVEEAEAARERLAWDEAFVLQTVLAQRRRASAELAAVARPAVADGLVSRFDAALPFELTRSQREVGDLLAAELAATRPMNRLLQGEVGSGKTVVALRAMLHVVDAGGQAALLAPTEVLAQQHHRTVTELLGPLGEGAGLFAGSDVATTATLLTGSMTAAQRRRALLEIASGEAGIVIGTHALLEDRVDFADLGLVVVDEQHRFGVEQRDALRAKSAQPPHVLVMTATPIPRTVAMTVFGDLEISTVREVPSGRAILASHVVPSSDRPHYLERAWERVREEVARGRQAFVVCPSIGEVPESGAAPRLADEEATLGEDAERTTRALASVVRTLEELRQGPLAGLRLAALHGRQPPEDKDATMRAFAAGDVDVLVATTVIEVGVNVPNATVMVVLDADRFGISQLHQLRGRVGRGSEPGVDLLVTPLLADDPARQRLERVAETHDGFALAELDLQTRREGDVLGVDQSGTRSSLQALQVLQHEDIIREAREEATALVASDAALVGHPSLRRAVEAVLDRGRADYLDKS